MDIPAASPAAREMLCRPSLRRVKVSESRALLALAMPDSISAARSAFSAAAAENGISRILVGFHFRKAVDEGIEHGNRIGDLAVDRFLRPVR